ncbi:MAG TPA: biopolymer transporter ExbD [Chitinophagaceae bacterium]|nr:biopolymer transporter ExbD [Chitinophagaceae bacterium]
MGGRPKIARKSTNIDMTAMCDVAFLLLSFFILTTKFKPAEAVPVETPNSVSSKVAPEKDVVLVTINRDGKVFLSIEEEEKKSALINTVNQLKSLGLTEAEMAKLAKAPMYGVAFSQLKQQAALASDQLNDKTLPGIPAKDSTNNEMKIWMQAVKDVYTGQKMNLLMKGDLSSKYPAFNNIIKAFKDNDLLKFQMVTNPEGVPVGTDLYIKNMKTGGSGEGTGAEE